MRILRSVGMLAMAGGLMVFAGRVGWSQQGGGQNTGQGGNGMGGSMGTTQIGHGGASQAGQAGQTPPGSILPADVAPSPDMEANQAKMRNSERQKQLVADTQKLLALANELKVDVDKTNKDTLSLEVMRKADEIEKLARSVKEKMKGS